MEVLRKLSTAKLYEKFKVLCSIKHFANYRITYIERELGRIRKELARRRRDEKTEME